MLQNPNKVLVSVADGVVTGTVKTLGKGRIALFDENKKLITANNTTANTVYVGLIGETKGDVTDIKFSEPINAGKVNSVNYKGYSQTKEDIIVVDLSDSSTGDGVLFSAGERVVLRIVYHDIYEHPGQFSHTYEHIVASGETADVVANSLVSKINKHTGRRVIASFSGAQEITITAIPKDDNEGKESINKYSRVSMDATAWKTIPSSFNSSPIAIPGITITKSPGTDGLGNPKIVRDREQEALGYAGITNRTHFPVIKPELNVDLSKQYDYVTVEHTIDYQSPDNQRVNSTKVATELYIPTGTNVATANTFMAHLKAWFDAKSGLGSFPVKA